MSDVLGEGGKKKIFKNARFNFKTSDFAIEVDAKYERLDPKKILPFEEYTQDKEGNRVIGKKVGYNNGELKYFRAIQDEKGKWFEMDGDELLARAFQHEIDHLDGVLFIFRMSALKRSLNLRKIRKMQREGKW